MAREAKLCGSSSESFSTLKSSSESESNFFEAFFFGTGTSESGSESRTTFLVGFLVAAGFLTGARFLGAGFFLTSKSLSLSSSFIVLFDVSDDLDET